MVVAARSPLTGITPIGIASGRVDLALNGSARQQ
jgi:hypothetical protein